MTLSIVLRRKEHGSVTLRVNITERPTDRQTNNNKLALYSGINFFQIVKQGSILVT